ncbi:MAG: hypothetical protein WAV46_02920 [Candidatus Moraniibacteriota bacterium]
MTTKIGKGLWQEGVHPLINSMDGHLQTWSQWKDEFRNARLCEHYEMLIRRGWCMDTDDIHGEESVERILFYLRMAEGHLTARTLEKPGDRRHEWSDMRSSLWWNSGRGTDRDWRRNLAHLAYKEFVYNFLRDRTIRNNDESQASRYPWLKWIVDERVMTALLRFFRIESGVMPNFPVTGNSDEDKKTAEIVTETLVNLSAAKWHMGHYYSMAGKELPTEFLVKHALTFLEILFVLKRLDVFERNGMYIAGYTKLSDYELRLSPDDPGVKFPEPIWSPIHFEETELAKLRDLALYEQFVFPEARLIKDGWGPYASHRSEKRNPVSIHEAITVVNSQIAKIYTLICNRQGVDWRP